MTEQVRLSSGGWWGQLASYILRDSDTYRKALEEIAHPKGYYSAREMAKLASDALEVVDLRKKERRESEDSVAQISASNILIP